MRIDHIEINNFLGLRHAQFDLADTSVALVAGHNRVGKSTVRDALRFAFTGDPGRVSLKKDYGALLSEGAKSGTIRIDAADGAVLRYVADGKAEVPPYDGAGVYPEGMDNPALPLVIDADTFARQPVDERRRQLFAIAGIDIKHVDITARLSQRGLTGDPYEDLLDDALRHIRIDGFEGGEKQCKELARQAKANWRAVTGENYGGKKAEGWQPQPVDFDAIGHQQALDRQQAVQHRIGELREQIGALRAKAEVEIDETERKELQDAADRVAARQQYVADLERKLAEARSREDAKRQAAEAEKRQGDADHRERFNIDAAGALNDLIADHPMDETLALDIVLAIAAGEIPHVSINY